MPSRTFLQLAQKLRQETEIGSTGPSAVLNQSGQLARLVSWIQDGWVDLQNLQPNWRWLRSEWSVNTVASDDTYAGTDCTDTIDSTTITRFRCWWPFDEDGNYNVKSYLQSSGVGGENWLTYLPWSTFRGLYRVGTQTDGQPIHYSIDPRNKLVLGPKPNAVYVVSGEYQKSAQNLAADGDIPELPADYHDLIVYYAMQKYGANSIAQETYLRGVGEGRRMMNALEMSQLPEIGLAEPLV